MALAESLYDELTAKYPALKTEVVIDDRLQMSIGQRLCTTRASGYPHAVVLGKKVRLSELFKLMTESLVQLWLLDDL